MKDVKKEQKENFLFPCSRQLLLRCSITHHPWCNAWEREKISFKKYPLAPLFQRGGLLLLAISLLSGNSYAENSLSSLMQRMQSETAVKMAYQEIRTLELMDQPWHGSGYMYSIVPDLMIREQLKPQRLLMGIKGDKMFYFDPSHHLRHQSEMDENNPLSLNIAVFKALITADEALLKRMYLIEFSNKPERWVMTLKSKQQDQLGFSIVVSGLTAEPADTIITKQADGDLSEFMLQQMAQGDEVKKTANQLYKELIGE